METNISIPCPAGQGMFMFVKKSGQSFLLHFAHLVFPAALFF